MSPNNIFQGYLVLMSPNNVMEQYLSIFDVVHQPIGSLNWDTIVKKKMGGGGNMVKTKKEKNYFEMHCVIDL